ncbi:hypothetical protein OJ996_23140 [Luteolibacter sp. GHJ8]|uniref:DUF4034 domain-containing protein n=1 Tax=Luteolibacter rhizosphaerae TaxID=2989719 RepID=A0ABT3GA33_9BACT|nr:hypothetical protein [Luteolibacter rhizosphaerae]MCW1916502.1 hypothetical protein [Luteolibacter rhizosphaerae]
MKRRLWLLPPLLAVAGYLSSDAVVAAKQSGDRKEVAKGREREERPRFTMEQAMEELSGDYQANPGVIIEEVPEEDLKQRLLSLGKLREDQSQVDRDYYRQKDYYEMEYRLAAYELVERIQREGVEWIEQNLPDLRLIAMQAWAMADPEAAWQAIIHSKRQPPCDPFTLMEALKNRAKANDGTLKQACLEVPWELFSYCDYDAVGLRVDPRMYPHHVVSFYSSDELAPWIESGAAQAIASQGLELHGFFESWSRDDAPAALRAWPDWPATSSHARDFAAMLEMYADGETPNAEIVKILEEYSPEQRAKAAAAITNKGRSKDPFALDLTRYYPALGLPVPELPPR